ncbi:MAG: UDP-N-acetylglucosamine 1-carboxyvinyltransferase, partial [Clostridia bacterium]|nr:UDP-N-acetylglucosamine 1-carboxyvinyltransferase [Clostridia bacterium]
KTYTIIPDQIEAGTYMVAAATVGGTVKISNVIPKHLETIAAKIEECGASVKEGDDYVIVSRDRKVRLKKNNIKTLPYPGFPTDMQPQITTMLCLAEGTSIVTEGVWDHRFRYIDELRRMGAKAEVDGRVCVVEGVEKLQGTAVNACDLRAGVALVIAGLCAEGITEVGNIKHVERGYEDLVEKLRSLGAAIQKVSDDTAPVSEDTQKIG